METLICNTEHSWKQPDLAFAFVVAIQGSQYQYSNVWIIINFNCYEHHH